MGQKGVFVVVVLVWHGAPFFLVSGLLQQTPNEWGRFGVRLTHEGSACSVAPSSTGNNPPPPHPARYWANSSIDRWASIRGTSRRFPFTRGITNESYPVVS